MSSCAAQMLKPLGLTAAIYMLNIFDVFNNIYKWFAFMADNAYKSTYNAITGMNFTWVYMKGQTMPIQMGYINSDYRYKAEWFFNERTQQWSHRNALFQTTPHYFPFIMTSLVTPEEEYDLTEYFNNQTYYCPETYYTMPLPTQLLNTWCISTHKWFTADELRQSYFTIMGPDCNTYKIPIILRTRDDVRIYSELFGMHIPESDEESSESSMDVDGGSEGEGDVEEEEEDNQEEEEDNQEEEEDNQEEEEDNQEEEEGDIEEEEDNVEEEEDNVEEEEEGNVEEEEANQEEGDVEEEEDNKEEESDVKDEDAKEDENNENQLESVEDTPEIKTEDTTIMQDTVVVEEISEKKEANNDELDMEKVD